MDQEQHKNTQAYHLEEVGNEKHPAPLSTIMSQILEKVTTADTVHGFTADSNDLPKGYYISASFVGTMFAVGFGLMAGVGGFALAAPNLALINEDIGPDPNYVWIGLVYSLTLAIGLLLVGRLSDLFGRRWFFISGQVLALLGSIVAATATTINTMIGAMVLISLGASAQLSPGFVSNELVPMKYRFLCNAWLYFWTIPISGFGPVVSKSFILRTSVGWRGGYYLMIAVNVIAGVLYYLFYFPPTFHMKFSHREKFQQLKKLDFLGVFLFTAGLLLFLMGLSWGSSHLNYRCRVCPSCRLRSLGDFCAAYGTTYSYSLFNNFGWVAVCINLGLGASVYYGMAIIWPQMVAVLYTDDGGASMYAGWLNSLVGIMIVLGELVAGCLAVILGKTKIQGIVVLTIGAALLAATASCGVDDRTRATVLISLGCFFVGWNEAVCLTNAGIEVDDQQEIGTAIGFAGSLRASISNIAQTVYVVMLTNRLETTIPDVIQAGLPETSVMGFLTGISTGNFSDVVGLTSSITAIGIRAYKEASAQAYSTVFLVTLVFSGMAIILSFFTPNVDDKMTSQVAATLHNRGNEGLVAEKQVFEV